MHRSRIFLLSWPLLCVVLSCGEESQTSARTTRDSSADQVVAKSPDAGQTKNQTKTIAKDTQASAPNVEDGVTPVDESAVTPVETPDETAEVPPKEEKPEIPASKLSWDGQSFKGDGTYALIPAE